MTQIDFYYDFGSPNVYFADKALAKLSGIEVIMHPVLIGGVFKSTNNQPPWLTFAKVPAKMRYEQLEITRFIEDHKLTDFKFNSAFPVNTLLAMRGAIAAQKAGVHEAYYRAGIKAIWEDNQNISQPEILASVMDAAGLDGKALVEATGDPEIKQGLMDATADCVARGVFGLPAMFVGDDLYFGKDRVWQIEQRLKRA